MPPSAERFSRDENQAARPCACRAGGALSPAEASQSEASRSFAHEGTNEHQIVEKQLQKLSAEGDKKSEVGRGVEGPARARPASRREEESTGFSCARNDFGKDELEKMAGQFQTRKAQLATRLVQIAARGEKEPPASARLLPALRVKAGRTGRRK